MARILVADDEEGIRAFVAEALELDGHTVETAEDGQAALEQLQDQSFDVVVTDLNMPRLGGMELLSRVRTDWQETEVVVLTAHGTVSTAVDAMKQGAFDYVQKPLDSLGELRLIVTRALERRRLKAHAEEVQRQSQVGPGVSHGDPAMEPVVEALRKVARTQATVLLLGESGTGKEVAARELHRRSDRADGPFVAINCAALSSQLLESELFGHEKGAFTGAHAQRRGRVELADGGTFFLDEVGELDPALQAKLLRVLEERSFERVGGTRTLYSNVRWVAATNRDLQKMIREGVFREDLYHRLAVFPIRLPPLRERRSDILPIARRLLGRIAGELGKSSLSLDPEVSQLLQDAPWPGNVRQLRNTLERAAILADDHLIRAKDLWLDEASEPDVPPKSGPITLEAMEKEAIQAALQRVGGNRKRAAEALGIGVRTLYDKLKRYGIS